MTSKSDFYVNARSFLEGELPRFLSLFEKTVRVNSHTPHWQGVNEVGALTADFFSPLGFFLLRFPTSETAPEEGERRGDHLLLIKDATVNDAKSVLLISHLDTVFSEKEERLNNFSWRIEGDKIYGPGTCDIKGGTIVALMALEALRFAAPDIFARLRVGVALNSQEETSSHQFREVCQSFYSPTLRACLVFEQAGGSPHAPHVVLGRKGRAVFEITATGRNAHSGVHHEKGANAIVLLSRIVSKIHDLTNYERGVTLNVGVIIGGEAINRVPHSALVTGEIRAKKIEDLNDCLAALRSIVESESLRSGDSTFVGCASLKVSRNRAPWFPSEGDYGLAAWCKEEARAIGFTLGEEYRGGITDANLVADLAPTLCGLGPFGANDHCSQQSSDGSKEQEYASLSSLIPMAMLNAGLLLRIAEEEFSSFR
jgi:glutamate carboxypeptidase